MRAIRQTAIVLALLGAGTAQAAPLKVATWNLEWLTARPAGDPLLPGDVGPKAPEDRARLRLYAGRLNADVVGIEEVDGPAIASEIFPADRYDVLMTGDPVAQRVGLAIRHGLAVTRHPDLVALDVYPPTAPHPLRSGLDVTIGSGSDALRILVVHLKSGCWAAPLSDRHRSACPVLAAQREVLRGWIDARRDADEAFLILGDFNRRFPDSDPFLAALDGETPLADVTQGRSSPCWGGEDFIDHILAGGAARQWLQPGSLRVLVYDEHDPAMKARLSDHCPVSARFMLP